MLPLQWRDVGDHRVIVRADGAVTEVTNGPFLMGPLNPAMRTIGW